MSYLILMMYFVWLSVWDIRKKELPATLLLTGLGVSLVYGVWNGEGVRLLVGLLPGMLLILMGFLTREKVGYGDGAMVIVIGLVTGWPGCFLIYLIAQFGVLFWAAVLLVCKRADRNMKIPFAPFLTAGILLYRIGGLFL